MHFPWPWGHRVLPRLFVVCMLALGLILAASLPALGDRFRIDLTNGRSVETEEFYRDGRMIYYKRHGLFIGVEAALVRSIEAVGATDEEPAGGEVASSGVFRRREVDLGEKVDKAYPPRNGIEAARNATVRIETVAGHGSGFFVSPDGFILTCKHVVRGDQETYDRIEAEIGEEEAYLDKVQSDLAFQAKQIGEWQADLEERKRIIARQRRSRARTANEQRYQSDLDYVDHMRSQHDLNLRKFEKRKEAFQEKKTEYESEKFGLLNQHTFKILLADKTELDGTLVATSADQDLALLKLDQTRVKYLTPCLVPANVAGMSQGEKLFAIGNPVDLRNSVTSGILSHYDGRKKWIQTNAQINPGNSGGPLVTEDGRVVGVNTRKLVGPIIEGISFATDVSAAFQEFSGHVKPCSPAP